MEESPIRAPYFRERLPSMFYKSPYKPENGEMAGIEKVEKILYFRPLPSVVQGRQWYGQGGEGFEEEGNTVV